MIIIEILREADFEAFFQERASLMQRRRVFEYLVENPWDATWLASKFRRPRAQEA